MGSFVILVIGDWRRELEQHKDSFLHVSGDLKQFLLKPGAIGWEVDEYHSEDIEVAQGYASSARLCDIDFAKMREPQLPANWEWARRLLTDKVLEYQEVLMEGRFLGRIEESELLSRLSGDSHLTSLVLKQ